MEKSHLLLIASKELLGREGTRSLLILKLLVYLLYVLALLLTFSLCLNLQYFSHNQYALFQTLMISSTFSATLSSYSNFGCSKLPKNKRDFQAFSLSLPVTQQDYHRAQLIFYWSTMGVTVGILVFCCIALKVVNISYGVSVALGFVLMYNLLLTVLFALQPSFVMLSTHAPWYKRLIASLLLFCPYLISFFSDFLEKLMQTLNTLSPHSFSYHLTKPLAFMSSWLGIVLFTVILVGTHIYSFYFKKTTQG